MSAGRVYGRGLVRRGWVGSDGAEMPRGPRTIDAEWVEIREPLILRPQWQVGQDAPAPDNRSLYCIVGCLLAVLLFLALIGYSDRAMMFHDAVYATRAQLWAVVRHIGRALWHLGVVLLVIAIGLRVLFAYVGWIGFFLSGGRR